MFEIADVGVHALMDAVPDALVVTDALGRIAFVNASCETMFGYARAELSGQPIELLVPEHRRDAHAAVREAFARAPVARPMGTGALLAGRKKDGSQIPVEVSLGRVTTKSGVLLMAVVRDATARQEAQERLRRSEQRYRELFETAPDGIFMATSDGRYTDVNAAGCRLLGYAREELIGRSVTEFVAPDALPRQSALVRHIHGGGSEVAEWELRRKDGTYVTVELSANALPDGQMRAIVRDVSERKRAEEAVSRSEESLARAQRIAHVGSFDWDIQANKVDRSAELCALFGLDPEAGTVPPYTLSEMFHPADREEARQAVRMAAEYGHSYRCEHRITRRDGSERVVFHQGDAVMVGGRVTRVVGTMLDITERKRAESEREASLEELQAVLDQCPVGIVLARGARAEELRLNDRAKNLVGRTIDRHGQYPEILLTPDEVPVELDQHPTVRAVRGERFESAEFLLQRADGSKIPVSVSGSPVPDGSGGIPKAVIVFQDISAAKHLERLRAEWSSIVAHDLRQPLNSVVLHTSLLKRALARAPGGPLAEALKAADTVTRAATRLNRMIGDLLDLSQLEARRVTLSRCPTDVAALVRSTVEALSLGEGAPTIEVRVDGAVPLANVDPDRIAQVLENLLSNATKYGAPQRAIVVEVGATPEEVRVAVTNEGPGIKPEELSGLFERFVRAEGATRGQVKGIGLGLYITRELVAAHGGQITAESVPGDRTTFRFTIPIRGSGMYRAADGDPGSGPRGVGGSSASG